MTSDSSSINLFEAIRVLRCASGALLDQAILHGELVRIEWAQEKARLLQMLAGALAGYMCLLCALLFAGALVLALCWGTIYRIPAASALMAFYVLGAAVSWRRFRALAALSGQGFAVTRAELAADFALLRSRL